VIRRWEEQARLGIEQGTGASIAVRTIPATAPGERTALEFRFADLGRNHGPVVKLRPSGLYRHVVSTRFGRFSGEVVASIRAADDESRALALALFRTVSSEASLHMEFGEDDEWPAIDHRFRVRAERRLSTEPLSDDALASTCRQVVVPVMAAFAELIGYEPDTDVNEPNAPAYASEGAIAMEGALALGIVQRRERNPRNRTVCLATHGHVCAACEIDPRDVYGEAGMIEVHHLQPLALVDGPRCYDPTTDLVPLCPGCHRAAHTRRPLPLTPDEIRVLRNTCRG